VFIHILLFLAVPEGQAGAAGVIGSGTHSWRNQNKNATDNFTGFTDLLNIPNHILGQVAPVQTYHLPGLLNLWNPWRFCF
jgi:hypothetical protein